MPCTENSYISSQCLSYVSVHMDWTCKEAMKSPDGAQQANAFFWPRGTVMPPCAESRHIFHIKDQHCKCPLAWDQVAFCVLFWLCNRAIVSSACLGTLFHFPREPVHRPLTPKRNRGSIFVIMYKSNSFLPASHFATEDAAEASASIRHELLNVLNHKFIWVYRL